MKKQFIVGMMLMTTAVSFNVHAAGVKGTETARESIKRYVDNMKKFASEVKAPSADLRSQQVAKALDTTVDQLNISGGEKASIKSLIANSKNNQAALTGSLAAIIGAKSATAGKKGDAESTSIDKAADAALNLMSNAVLVGAKETSSSLSPKELAETRDALKKLISMPDKFITFETKERDSYTNIIMKADELSTKSETYEDAFVKAIMENQKVSKDKALEIVRKLKECV